MKNMQHGQSSGHLCEAQATGEIERCAFQREGNRSRSRLLKLVKVYRPNIGPDWYQLHDLAVSRCVSYCPGFALVNVQMPHCQRPSVSGSPVAHLLVTKRYGTCCVRMIVPRTLLSDCRSCLLALDRLAQGSTSVWCEFRGRKLLLNKVL